MNRIIVALAASLVLTGFMLDLTDIANTVSDKVLLFTDSSVNAVDCAVSATDIYECSPELSNTDFKEDLQGFHDFVNSTLENLTNSGSGVTISDGTTIYLEISGDEYLLVFENLVSDPIDLIKIDLAQGTSGEQESVIPVYYEVAESVDLDDDGDSDVEILLYDRGETPTLALGVNDYVDLIPLNFSIGTVLLFLGIILTVYVVVGLNVERRVAIVADNTYYYKNLNFVVSKINNVANMEATIEVFDKSKNQMKSFNIIMSSYKEKWNKADLISHDFDVRRTEVFHVLNKISLD